MDLHWHAGLPSFKVSRSFKLKTVRVLIWWVLTFKQETYAHVSNSLIKRNHILVICILYLTSILFRNSLQSVIPQQSFNYSMLRSFFLIVVAILLHSSTPLARFLCNKSFSYFSLDDKHICHPCKSCFHHMTNHDPCLLGDLPLSLTHFPMQSMSILYLKLNDMNLFLIQYCTSLNVSSL
jgi:hypothetical protein